MSVEIAAKRFSAIASIERQILALEQLKKNLAGGRRDRIDVDEVAIARIARMMVDVDPDFRPADGGQGIVAESLPGRGVERKDDIEIFGLVRRDGNQFAAGKKGKFFEQSLFVPDFDSLAQLLQREPHRDLAAERVPIRADMAENDETLVLAQGLSDFREGRVR